LQGSNARFLRLSLLMVFRTSPICFFAGALLALLTGMLAGGAFKLPLISVDLNTLLIYDYSKEIR